MSIRDVVIAITAASYSGNKGAAAMLQSSISQLRERYGSRFQVNLMSVYPAEDREQLPYDNIVVVPTKPQQLLFMAFPLAILYRLFHWFSPIRWILLKNNILRAYSQADFVIDEAGISFVDSRGFIMNTYAFVCVAVPLLMGVPVAKYSQALGTFHDPYNRFLAKWILPKLSFIAARGRITLDHLEEIGVKDNVGLCADGAFSMPDSNHWATCVARRCAEDHAFYESDVVGLSISSVVNKKCSTLGIDYVSTMVGFANGLIRRGYSVLLIANAARIRSRKPRNNDLLVCDAVYERLENRSRVRWYHEEMCAEEIREYIARCRFLVASRFHAMVGALAKGVPVLLVGWSHKYQEVLDMFELGRYASDFSDLSAEKLMADFESFVQAEPEIREKLRRHHNEVENSSRKNIDCIASLLDGIVANKRTRNRMFDLDNPDRYIGQHIACKKGYATDPSIRASAASGGMVTALLLNLLKHHDIDGAWVTKTAFINGKLTYRTYIATTEDEIRDAGTSVYMSISHMKHLVAVRNFTGRLAVVLTPCMMAAFDYFLAKDPELAKRIVLKVGLYCSGNHRAEMTTLAIEKAGLSCQGASRLFYRKGHWRGVSHLEYENGTIRTFSYTKLICAYKNAGFFEKQCCMRCQDHFALAADISFGDVWLREMKSNPIKHSSCVVRTQRAMDFLGRAVSDGDLHASYIRDRDILRSQKRALVFKFNHDGDHSHWNHRLAYRLSERNRIFSENHFNVLRRIPSWLIYLYMCFIRILLSC